MTSWYSLVPMYCSEAVGALLHADARPDQPNRPYDADAAAQPMSCMCPSPICAPGLHGVMGATKDGRCARSSGWVPQDSYVMQYGPAGRQIQMIDVCTHKFNQTSGPNYRR